MDALGFLEGDNAPEDTTPAATVEPPVTPEVSAQPEGPARAPDGKFAAKEPDVENVAPAEEAPDPTHQAAVEPTVPPGHVPLAAMLDTRDKLKAAEAQLEAMRRQIAEAQQPQVAPDPYDDPQGFQAFQAQQIQQATLNTRLDLSEEIAIGRYGQETVTAAQQWALERAQTSPFYGQEVLSSRNPYEKVIQDYKRDQLVASLGETDLEQFEQFKAWQAAQAQIRSQVPVAALAASQQPAAPTRSLASAPSAGGPQSIPTGPGVAFDAAIPQ